MNRGDKRVILFTLKQRIAELKKALKHWPMSDRVQNRMDELRELTDRLKTYKEKD